MNIKKIKKKRCPRIGGAWRYGAGPLTKLDIPATTSFCFVDVSTWYLYCFDSK